MGKMFAIEENFLETVSLLDFFLGFITLYISSSLLIGGIITLINIVCFILGIIEICGWILSLIGNRHFIILNVFLYAFLAGFCSVLYIWFNFILIPAEFGLIAFNNVVYLGIVAIPVIILLLSISIKLFMNREYLKNIV